MNAIEPPLAPDRPNLKGAPSQEIVRGRRILLVDDEMTVRQSLRMLLEIDDHVVTEARNGAEALDLFAKAQFDVVITDYQMPVMKGDELAVRIKDLRPKQPILMVTAYEKEPGDPGNPVSFILKKPFLMHDLRRVITELLPK